MAIKRTVTEAVFSVNVNIILSGSKRLSQEQQDALMAVDAVRVQVVDASNPNNILLDTVAGAQEFGTGSVGYSVQKRDCQFSEAVTPESLFAE